MGWAEPLARPLDERRVAQRALGVALVALLHILLLAALLHSVIHPARPNAAREIFLRFMPRMEMPKPPPKAPAESARPLRGGMPPTVMTAPPVTVSPAPALRGLGQSLFGCSPENMESLSPQARGDCLAGLGRRDIDTTPRDHSQHPGRWARAIRERNAPLGQIPCGYIAETPYTAGVGGFKVPMADLTCLRKKLSQ